MWGLDSCPGGVLVFIFTLESLEHYYVSLISKSVLILIGIVSSYKIILFIAMFIILETQPFSIMYVNGLFCGFYKGKACIYAEN